jgi:signal transduction histidine kinase
VQGGAAPGAPGFSAFIRDLTERKKADAEREGLTKNLITASRQAGMAEVATGVLHNVGNVLNSVNISASASVNMIRKSRVGGVTKAAALLQEHAGRLDDFLTADDRGKQLLPYLSSLGEMLNREQAQVLEELDSLTKNIDHIKQIVAMQQSFARVAGTTEDIELSDVIEDAVKINLAGLDRHHVRLERRLAELPTIRTDKHKVLQVLTNLIGNAKYALSDKGGEDRRMVIETGRRDAADGGEQRVFVRVIDNGVGISRENLTRIFSHGFTTKKDGHGFGLHSGALAARELGGALIVHSDGVGEGAAFTLELPLVAPAQGVRA